MGVLLYRYREHRNVGPVLRIFRQRKIGQGRSESSGSHICQFFIFLSPASHSAEREVNQQMLDTKIEKK